MGLFPHASYRPWSRILYLSSQDCSLPFIYNILSSWNEHRFWGKLRTLLANLHNLYTYMSTCIVSINWNTFMQAGQGWSLLPLCLYACSNCKYIITERGLFSTLYTHTYTLNLVLYEMTGDSKTFQPRKKIANGRHNTSS